MLVENSAAPSGSNESVSGSGLKQSVAGGGGGCLFAYLFCFNLKQPWLLLCKLNLSLGQGFSWDLVPCPEFP